MPLTLPVNTVAECLRTDCYILGDKKKILQAPSTTDWKGYRSAATLNVLWTKTLCHTVCACLYVRYVFVSQINIRVFMFCNKPTNGHKQNIFLHFITYYYSPTCFGRFCYQHQGVTQEYK